MFKNLQTALFTAFMALFLFAFILLALLVTPSIRKTATNQISQDLIQQVLLASTKYENLLVARASSQILQQQALNDAKLSHSRVTVIASNGKVIADSATPYEELNTLENHAKRPELIAALQDGRGRSVRYSTTIEENLIYTAIPLYLRVNQTKKLLGFLRFSVPSILARDLVLAIYRSMLMALLATVVVAMIVSMFLARLFTQPIVRLSEVAHKIAKGDFPQTIMHRSRFEIGNLEEAVEQMSYRLAETFKRLAAEKSQVSALLFSMTEGVIAVDQKGKVVFINPVIEKVFDIAEPEVLGKTVREGIHNNDLADLVEGAQREKKHLQKEIDLFKSGQEMLFVAQASPIRDRQENIIGSVCLLYNVTEIRKLENYRSQFVANVSHELKTPLTAIRGYVETLLSGAIDDQKNNRIFLDKIEKHALNLSNLIDDILTVSCFESQQDLGQFKPVDLKQVVERAVETIFSNAKKKGLKLEKVTPQEDLMVSGSEEHLYRAVLNLLDNAIKYTNKGGRIVISLNKDANQVRLVVADNGLGIPAEDIPRIFERFYRVDKARSRDLGGTGLGLSIVKHVMNIHQGSIKVDSTLGQGSSFTLVFPL